MVEYINIQKWMVDGLGLSGNELIAFAIIFGFSQDGESKFKGSLRYIMNWLGCSKPTAVKTLSTLVEKGYVIKEEESIGGIKFCRYSVPIDELNQWLKYFTGGGKETLPGVVKKLNPIINIDNINNKNTPNIDKSILPPEPKEQKIEYDKGVKLRPSEYRKLVQEFGEQDAKGMIRYFSRYRQEKGYKNKEDYLSIRRWVVKAYYENKPKTSGTNYKQIARELGFNFGDGEHLDIDEQ